MQLEELVGSIADFAQWTHPTRIKLFAWHLHTHRQREHFATTDIRACYDALNIQRPANIHAALVKLVERKPKELLRSAAGFRLEKQVRDDLDAKYGQRVATVHVHKLLSGLPVRVPNIDERDYLNEALICFRSGAFRAAIVMTWNLAYDHLCEYVLAKHLPAFNAQLPKSFPRFHTLQISKRDDFTELKESEMIQVCDSAIIISGNVRKILNEKLTRRNIAAHASNVVVSQLQAEDFIKDLIENVVLKLA